MRDKTKTDDPCIVVPTPTKGLTIDDLVKIWHAAGRIGEPRSTMIRFMIITGQSRQDICHIRNALLFHSIWALERHGEKRFVVPLSTEAMSLLSPYRRTAGYFFRSPKLPLHGIIDPKIGSPIGFSKTIRNQLRTLASIPWQWGLSDIQRAVWREFGARSGRSEEECDLWSNDFMKELQPDLDLEELFSTADEL